MNIMSKFSRLFVWAALATSMHAHAANVDEVPLGEAVERHLSDDVPLMKWVQDPEDTETEQGDTIATRETLEDELETIKLS